ncbi:MAG TPA: hypothetical protein DDY14_06870 [Chromatiaceae bacterium]|mgnify:CR=1 FL=1|jgi:hypothetical protein|nr:hypothetical protein [Chromatiaceae bacterium]HCS88507.1 hypothetical protein [Chromatiaceae bacterium]
MRICAIATVKSALAGYYMLNPGASLIPDAFASDASPKPALPDGSTRPNGFGGRVKIAHSAVIQALTPKSWLYRDGKKDL